MSTVVSILLLIAGACLLRADALLQGEREYGKANVLLVAGFLLFVAGIVMVLATRDIS